MTESAKKRVMPDGKRKGGARYPRITLLEAVGYGAKLVSKTHISPQPEGIIFPGVFGTKPGGTTGQIRASALKQFGLMEGLSSAYTATKLARDLAAAPQEEREALLRTACLMPPIFRTLFETYHGDEVTLAKVRQQASSSNVHPDEVDNCVAIFVDSATEARLAVRDGDLVRFVAAADAPLATNKNVGADDFGEAEANDTSKDRVEGSAPTDAERPLGQRDEQTPPPAVQGRAIIHVNFTLDSSFDTDKLARQLELLRKFGAI
jgi:hypothetical protein